MEFIERNIGNHNTVVLLLSSCFTLIVLTRWLFENRFHDFFELLKNGKYLVIHGKSSYNYDVFNVLFFIVQLLSLSIFITQFFPSLDTFYFNQVFYCFFLLTGLIICKYLFEKTIFVILGLEKVYDHVIFQKITYRNLIGVFIFLLNVGLFWVFDFSDTAVLVAGFIIVLLYTFTTLMVYRNHISIILNNLFYFILYLCALEIAPYILLYKLLA